MVGAVPTEKPVSIRILEILNIFKLEWCRWGPFDEAVTWNEIRGWLDFRLLTIPNLMLKLVIFGALEESAVT